MSSDRTKLSVCGWQYIYIYYFSLSVEDCRVFHFKIFKWRSSLLIFFMFRSRRKRKCPILVQARPFRWSFLGLVLDCYCELLWVFISIRIVFLICGWLILLGWEVGLVVENVWYVNTHVECHFIYSRFFNFLWVFLRGVVNDFFVIFIYNFCIINLVFLYRGTWVCHCLCYVVSLDVV